MGKEIDKGVNTIGQKVKSSFQEQEKMYHKIDRYRHKKDPDLIRLQNDEGGEFDVPYRSLVDVIRDSLAPDKFPWIGILSTLILFMIFILQIWTIYNLQVLIGWIEKLVAVLS